MPTYYTFDGKWDRIIENLNKAIDRDNKRIHEILFRKFSKTKSNPALKTDHNYRAKTKIERGGSVISLGG